MDRWDVLIIVTAGYVAVMTLVRMMATRRNRLVAELRNQIAEQRRRNAKQAQAAEEAEDAA